MKVDSISLVFRLALLIGSVIYLSIILLMLKRKQLTVRYSIIWLFSGCVFLMFAVFPYTVLVLRDLLKMEMPVNVVFMLAIAFVLLLLLSLSSTVSVLSEKQKRLTQTIALLEKRVRELENDTKK
ncbi:MAG: DUF2304 domain-containing protein [Ruthenibacterium sp.]